MRKSSREYIIAVITDEEKGLFADLLRIVFLLFSYLYGFIVTFLIYLNYPNRRFGFVTPWRDTLISVGNITWGGTGKTPLVIMLAEYLAKRGKKVVVAAGGYGGDEDLFLKNRLDPIPVVSGTFWAGAVARAAWQCKSGILIVDDGFQKWRLRRNLDIVAINCRNPFGNGYLLPRGILREPLPGLKRADVFFLTRADTGRENLSRIREKLRALNPRALVVEAGYRYNNFYPIERPGEAVSPESLAGKRAAVLAGIGDPRSFAEMAKNAKINCELEFFYPDHHRYRLSDLLEIAAACREKGVTTLITTEKDAVKVTGILRAARRSTSDSGPSAAKAAEAALFELRILVMPVELEIIENEQEFFNRLSGVLDS